MAVTILLWGVTFAAVSQMVIAYRRGERVSLVKACERVATETGWASLLWRLCGRLVVPGFLLMTIGGAAVYWLMKTMHVPFETSAGKLESELLSLLLLGIPYLLYVRRFTLSIPLAIAAEDAPIDPLSASAGATRVWRTPIVVTCLTIWGISNLADLHLPAMLLGPGLIRPTVISSYAVWILVSLATSLFWVWLFVFLTEIALAGNAAYQSAAEVPDDPAAVLSC